MSAAAGGSGATTGITDLTNLAQEIIRLEAANTKHEAANRKLEGLIRNLTSGGNAQPAVGDGLLGNIMRASVDALEATVKETLRVGIRTAFDTFFRNSAVAAQRANHRDGVWACTETLSTELLRLYTAAGLTEIFRHWRVDIDAGVAEHNRRIQDTALGRQQRWEATQDSIRLLAGRRRMHEERITSGGLIALHLGSWRW